MIAIVSAGLLTCSAAVRAQLPHIVGNWSLNFEKSEFPGQQVPLRSETRSYQLRPDGFLVGLSVSVGVDGSASFLQFAARPDGQDYPEYDLGTLADLQASGASTPMRYSETVIDEFTIAFIDKRDGQVTATGMRSVSEDSQTMTISVDVPRPSGQPISFELVYDRI
jgi:hypothetical protein